MRTVYVDGYELEILWDGSHQGKDADLFNALDVEARRKVPPAAPRAHQNDYASLVGPALVVLATRPQWRVKTLREALGIDPVAMNCVIQRLERVGKARRRDGIVSIIRRQEAA